MSKINYSIIPINSLIDSECLNSFTCGNEEEENRINNFLKQDAIAYDLRGITKTFLYVRDREVVGFFSLCTSETKVTRNFRTNKLSGNTLKCRAEPSLYPSIELTYFAIKLSEQKKKLGTSMMHDILELLYFQVYRHVGFVMVTLESRSAAKEFYTKMGFDYHKTKSGNDNLMALTITDIETILGIDY